MVLMILVLYFLDIYYVELKQNVKYVILNININYLYVACVENSSLFFWKELQQNDPWIIKRLYCGII